MGLTFNNVICINCQTKLPESVLEVFGAIRRVSSNGLRVNANDIRVNENNQRVNVNRTALE